MTHIPMILEAVLVLGLTVGYGIGVIGVFGDRRREGDASGHRIVVTDECDN